MKAFPFIALVLAPVLAGFSPFPLGGGASTLPVPPGAAAAGYTKLTFNSDFTQPQPTAWLGGCPTPGNDQPLSPSQYDDDGGPHTWWQNIWWSANNYCITSQVTDPVYGGMVLDEPWTVNNSQDNVGNTLQSQSWDYQLTEGQGQSPNAFPRGAYYELISRVDPLTTSIWAGLFTWGTLGGWGTTVGYQLDAEWDVEETWATDLSGYDTAIHNWGNPTNYNAFIVDGFQSLAAGTNFDPTNYNKLGMQVTVSSDGTTANGCTYINDVLQLCSGPVTLVTAQQGQKNFLLLQNGCHDAGTCVNGTLTHHYVKSVRVWVAP